MTTEMPLWWRRRWRHVKLHVEFREGHVRLCEMEAGTERGEEREGRGKKGGGFCVSSFGLTSVSSCGLMSVLLWFYCVFLPSHEGLFLWSLPVVSVSLPAVSVFREVD